jgi:hypothetical protein
MGPAPRIGRIVSGGQTGVDRAALDFAISRGVPYGGWCPAGGWAEDLTSPPGLLTLYPELRETPSRATRQRTRWNVRDSDGVVILLPASASSPGTDLTRLVAAELGKPSAVLDPIDLSAASSPFRQLLAALPDGAALNVAGPRESEVPGIYRSARAMLEALLGDLGH